MPIYTYQCDTCFETWTVRHGMSETVTVCGECGAESVVRIPSMVSSAPKNSNKSSKVGELTKEFIENSRKDLKTQRNELDKKR